MRFVTENFSPYFKEFFRIHKYSDSNSITALASEELAKACASYIRENDVPLVGFDLAGAEYGFPAEEHQIAFEIAQRNFIFKTVHAGEAYGPESIFQAITDLDTDRIGHGLNLYNYSIISEKRAILCKKICRKFNKIYCKFKNNY